MNDNDTAREKALTGAITQIERQFGKGSIMRMADGNPQLSVESIPTGSLTLDLALGIGGVPRGRVVEIYGNESSGKTTLSKLAFRLRFPIKSNNLQQTAQPRLCATTLIFFLCFCSCTTSGSS